MPNPAYRQRIKKVLAVMAKGNQLSIPYVEFMERVKDSMTLDLLNIARGYDTRVHKALMRECKACHVKLVQPPNGLAKLTITTKGLDYFLKFGVVKLYERDAPAFQRLTLRQLRKETKALNHVLDEIRNVIRNSQFQPGGPYSFEEIPNIITRIVERINALGEQHTALTSMLADERGAERNIRSAFARNHSDDQ